MSVSATALNFMAAGGGPAPQGRPKRVLLGLVAGCLGPLVIAVVCQATYTVVTQRQLMSQGLADKAASLGALMVNVAGPSIAFDDDKAVSDALGFVAVASSPESYGAQIKADIETWSKVVRDANIKVD